MPLAKEDLNSVIDSKTGEFKRPAAKFRNFISSNPGAKFPPEKGRYHLYVSYACPWGKILSSIPNDLPQLTPLHSAQDFDRSKTERTGRYHRIHCRTLVHGTRWYW
jgi:glutathionyl-hydroquinone reductase